MKRPRIILADDHSLILTGICTLLADHFDVVAQVNDGRALIQQALRLRPDLIILDVTMPLLNGIDAARQIRNEWPDAKFLFLTMHADAMYLRNALEAGACGYLLKSSAAEELQGAIRVVLSGRTYLSKAIPWQVKDAIEIESPRGIQSLQLTDRQREVLQLIAEGRGNKEIAGVLEISVKTVEFHRGQLMKSLGVHTVAELTQFAMRLGLVDKHGSLG